MSSLTGRTSSSSEMDITGAQREKRPAPRPPGRSSAQGQSGCGGSAQHLAHNTKQSEDVRAVSVLPERSVQMIAPLSCSPTDAENIQSSAQSNTAKETISEGKHSKRQAPSRPGSVEDRPPTGPKMATGAETPSQGCSEVKQEPTVHSINPFDEDEDELTVKADTAANAGSIQWPPAADKDVTSAAKIKPRKARAPTLPAQTTAASAGGHDSGMTMPDNSGRGSRDPKPQPVTVQNTAEKKLGPPATSRR